MNIFTQFFQKARSNPEELEQNIRRDLIRREARIGREVFGPIPAGRSREFFRIDKKTWIWQESWRENGSQRTNNTKYMVRERDIVKSVNGAPYQKVGLEEAKNLEAAIHTYVARVKHHIYDPVLK